MESDDSVDDYTENLPTSAANIVTNGVNSVSPRTFKTEQVFNPCGDLQQHENMVSCSSAPPSMVPMATAVFNQAGQLQPGMMTMQDPNSGELVVVQNMNGGANMDENGAKTLINPGSLSNSMMAKFGNAQAGAGMLPHIANGGQVITSAQLPPGMMSIAGLPQVAALGGLNGIPNINVMNQLQQAQLMQQQQQGGATACVTNPQMQAALPQGMVAVNGQQGAVQQHQVGNTPQFILAAGQPVQGIQGAQLLIPTSSGVATQQVITIPVSQLAGNQIVQLVASNGQIFTTTLANLQALSQPVPVPGVQNPNMAGNPQTVQSHPMLAPGFPSNMQGQISSVPQIFTNAAGQLVSLGPQIIAHPMMSGNPNSIMMNQQMAAATQLQQVPQPDDKGQVATVSSSQPTPINRIQNASLNAISQAIALQQQQQQQSAQMAMNPVIVTTQMTSPVKNQLAPQNCIVAPKLCSPGSTVSTLTQTVHPQPAVSPDDDCDNDTISNTEANVVDGINLEEIKEFAKAFKIRRLSLGLTQTQVGQALSATEGPSYSQSAICRFEKLDITPRSAQKIKPVLERWMKEAEERYKNGVHTLTEFIGSEPTKKRKRRTSFTPSALEILNKFFETNTHPSGIEMTGLAEHLNYDREVVRVWFCNKRQALKNTIKKLKTGQ
ncbi:POU domain, class 6, transcription factor 1 isoform X2 [Parasteatoda tepidariorum]|uniref:POU domain, class 6, transcription factor 1 isoform X2 n=1 Tax=Parasteatoda tepidariorum TaxID=114398 RepID=UPI001C72179C|nr:POU domain, class 6, transcription factor 1 isoform X2 [Parasteatoda tepidariorum]